MRRADGERLTRLNVVRIDLCPVFGGGQCAAASVFQKAGTPLELGGPVISREGAF